MADPFLAEIRAIPFNFPPKGWAMCNGQIMPVAQNTALFSLLGTTYGGDGKTTFALPDLQGRAPMHPGQGQGLSSRDLGESGGERGVTLLTSQIPVHQHEIKLQNTPADSDDPANAVWGNTGGRRIGYAYSTQPGTAPSMNPDAISNTGGSLPHNNMQPYLGLNFIIALQGVFPQRP